MHNRIISILWRQGVAVACTSALLAVVGVGAAHASPGGADARQVSLAGAVFVAEASENVDISGGMHVVTELAGSAPDGWTLTWHTNLGDTIGTGEATGDRYRGIGADQGTIAFPPGPPVREASFEPTFTLFPPGPPVHPPSPIRLSVRTTLDAAGHVTAIEVHVGEPIVDND